MVQNPYQPPGASRATAAATAGPISSEQESQVMQEIGRRRSRGFSLTLAISWPVIGLLLMFGVGLGLMLAAPVSGMLAAAFAKLVVRLRKRSIIRAALEKYGVPPGALDPAKYILD